MLYFLNCKDFIQYKFKQLIFSVSSNILENYKAIILFTI